MFSPGHVPVKKKKKKKKFIFWKKKKKKKKALRLESANEKS